MDTAVTQEQGGRKDVFTDRKLTAEQVRLFGMLCGLDKGPRGCFARRETLARMQGVSLTTINHQLSALKQRGYITISKKGRQPGEGAVIRVVPQARADSGFACASEDANLQPGCKEGQNGRVVAKRNLPSHDKDSRTCRVVTSMNLPPDDKKGQNGRVMTSMNLPCDGKLDNTHELDERIDFKTSETTNSYQEDRYPVPPGRKGGCVVVTQRLQKTVVEPPEVEPGSAQDRQVLAAAGKLEGTGMGGVVALSLARKHPVRQVRAALRYVRQGRGEALNEPGYVRFLLESNARLPGWCHDSGQVRLPEKPVASVAQVSSGVGTDGAREQCRTASPYAVLWSVACEYIRARIPQESFVSFFEPLFISEVEGETVILDAPDASLVDWVGEHYLWLIQPALQEAGLVVGRVEVRAERREG